MRETEWPTATVMDKRYIEFFNGYRHAYGVADFEHPDAYVDSETGKKTWIDTSSRKNRKKYNRSFLWNQETQLFNHGVILPEPLNTSFQYEASERQMKIK